VADVGEEASAARAEAAPFGVIKVVHRKRGWLRCTVASYWP
jgi:hypothetical protein